LVDRRPSCGLKPELIPSPFDRPCRLASAGSLIRCDDAEQVAALPEPAKIEPLATPNLGAGFVEPYELHPTRRAPTAYKGGRTDNRA
jgi:hypothetical protein